MPEKEYLPYKAINVFMDRNYLEKIIKEVLEGIGQLTKEEQSEFSQFFRKNINVLGFRNPVRAPLSLRVNAYASAFEEREEVIPYTLSTWASVKLDFAEKVKSWLETEGWKNLSLKRNFEENQGFLTDWPKKITFEKLYEKFQKAHPDDTIDRDDLILMVLWISGNLPKEQSD